MRAFHERMKDGDVRSVLAFLADPLAAAREHEADYPYAYALGSAQGHIESLLDALGYPKQGPDLMDVECYATHPLEYEEVVS